MYIKVTRRGPNRYVQLVEAYRDPTGKPKQRTLATLGRLDLLNTELNCVISGLQRVTGQTPVAASLPVQPPTPSFDAAGDFGDVYTPTELWNALGFDGLRGVFGHTRHSIDVEALIRVMVFNRLCDLHSKLGVLSWLKTVALPGTSLASFDHQHLLRAMEALVDHKTEVDGVMASLLRPLVDQDLAMVLPIEKILFCQSEEKYTRVVSADDEAHVRKPLKVLTDGLNPEKFWQIHRSILVRASSIARAQRDAMGRMTVDIRGSFERLKVSQAYA